MKDKLYRVFSCKLIGDGFKYEIAAYEEVLKIEYFEENQQGESVMLKSFLIPTYCAEQVIEETLDLIRRSKVEV